MIGANKIDWDEAQLSSNLWLFHKLDDFVTVLESKNLEDIEYLTDCIIDLIQDRDEAEHERETEYLESVIKFVEEVQEIVAKLCDCNTWIKPREDD